jgi:hypothetical protein
MFLPSLNSQEYSKKKLLMLLALAFREVNTHRALCMPLCAAIALQIRNNRVACMLNPPVCLMSNDV